MPWLWMLLVVLLFCLPLFAGLDRRDFDNDESIYSFAVDVMLKDGDWLTPKSIPDEARPFLEKPPLKFWIVALPIRLGLLPQNEFGMRFWDALMGSVAFLYVFAIGRRLAGPICGVAAVFLLFSFTPLVTQHGLRSNNMEASLFLAYVAGMYHFLAWRSSGPDNRSHLLAIALYFVLGFMTKFVAVLFLPAVLLVAVLLSPRDRLRLRLSWTSVVLASLLVTTLVVPWFLYEYVTRGSELLDTMFGGHVFKRFTASLDPSHLHPWHFYFTEIWHQLLSSNSMLLVVAGAVLLSIRIIRARWMDGVVVVLWFALPLALISAGTSKLYHYAYPFLPPVALAGGYTVATMTEWAWRWLRRPLEVVVDERSHVLPGWLGSSAAQWCLSAVGLGALSMAMATALLGRVRLAIGDVLLFRSSHVFTLVVAGVAMLGVGGRLLALRLVAPIGVLLLALPVQAYRHTVKDIDTVDHATRDVRACLMPIAQQAIDRGEPAPGVWAEGRTLAWPSHYYLRALGLWQQRDLGSDATVVTNLFVPAAYRPVLLSPERYNEFTAHMAADLDGLLQAAARKGETDLATAVQGFRTTELGYVQLLGATLILPGPYSVCGLPLPPHLGIGPR